MSIRIKGMRGSWIVDVAGHDRLPVVHHTFVDWKKLTYKEGVKGECKPRWVKHYEMIKETKMVVIQMDHWPEGVNVGTVARTGYWGIAYVDNVQWNDGVITFDITGRMS